jgi:hypothetical protein
MDLSDDENVRKHELRQVVDAFEYYVMEHSGVVILSTNTVGDYFYLLMGGSVRYYDHYKSTAMHDKNTTIKQITINTKVVVMMVVV